MGIQRGYSQEKEGGGGGRSTETITSFSRSSLE